MKNKKAAPPEKDNSPKRIKVRLDHKTLIMLKSLASFETWKKMYPEARIIA
ncbi:MAG TPA: hypothetical protein PLI47_06320 [Bacteroidia bacterium]|jgi:hypothetical protein|nr:hypothetical protein [Bacteroidia bacterium]HQW22895.1 hypothetical protein [Bacteroidia bacterium]